MSKKHHAHLSKYLTPGILKTGLALVLILFVWNGISRQQSQAAPQYEKTEAVVQAKIRSELVAVTFPSQKHTVQIQKGGFIQQAWIISDDHAHHDQISYLPFEGKNIILYGHNTNHIFGKLSTLKIGDRIILKNDINEEIEYFVASIGTIDSSDTSILKESHTEELILYTCTGWMDKERLLVRAKPVM